MRYRRANDAVHLANRRPSDPPTPSTSMSEIIGPDEPNRPMWEMTVVELLEAAVSRVPSDKVFAEVVGQKVTYPRFHRIAAQTAGMFESLGVGKGDRVCLFTPNRLEVLYCWFGLSMLGAITVPINTAYKRDEMAYILKDSAAKALVAHESLLPVADAAVRLASGVRRKLVIGAGDGWVSFDEALTQADSLARRPEVTPDDVSMLVYTSGTTGSPKGVQMTHKMYVAAGQGFAHWTQAGPDDRFFTCLPYCHANAQYYTTMGTLAVGATLVATERFSASRFWSEVREAKATVVNFIGMMMHVLAKRPESPSDRRNTVRLFYGSPSFPPEFLRAFEERFGTDVIVGFGMTETCYGTIEGIREARRAKSSGRPRQHPDPRFVNRIQIRDEAGNAVSPNKVGEIVISNPAVMPGYWRNEEETRAALRGGSLYTGDLGWMDEDGFLYFVDRKKDVIRRRGENISSQEVENVIKRHPAVLDCAVIAVPSELGEDEVKAYVMPRTDMGLEPEELIYWCAEHLAYFKVPRYVEVRSELPRTPSLRVRKDLLRQESADLTEGCFDRDQAGISIR